MIVVSGTFVLAAGTRREVLAAMAAVVAETAKEPGCITYRFYCDPDDENVYRVFEEWESDEHLAAHGRAPHLAAFRESLRKAGLIERKVRKYHVEKVEQL